MTAIEHEHTSTADGDLEALFDRRSVDRLLTTTRSVRRRLDLTRPVEPTVIEECLELAQQAPCAHNAQSWRWMVVTDRSKRKAIAEMYRIAWRIYASNAGSSRRRAARQRSAVSPAQTIDSAKWLAEHMHEVPVLILACIVGRPTTTQRSAAVASSWEQVERSMGIQDAATPQARTARAVLLRDAMFYGSIFPAIWSFQLALRSRGLGTVITSNHLPLEDHVANLLGIPGAITQVALLPVAYTTGLDFRAARRTPATELTSWNQWGRTRDAGEHE
jgi:nitroreductase